MNSNHKTQAATGGGAGQNRMDDFDSQKSDSTSRAANSGLRPTDQKENQAPRANEIYEEELPPESRVVSETK